jgi:chemotaxis receptor (MCP) glutamine deamidase CheD
MHNTMEKITSTHHHHHHHHHHGTTRAERAILLPELDVVNLHIGDLHASRLPVKIKTILGSCVSACLFDPATGVGGMNHFLLPGVTDDPDLSTRYGINAMEVLINEMMKLGAKRNSIQAKIFGGGDVIHANHHLLMVGEKNIRFVREFLQTESIPILTQRIGGHQGLVVVYLPHTFEVFVKPVSMERFNSTEETELSYRERLTRELAARQQEDTITLF